MGVYIDIAICSKEKYQAYKEELSKQLKENNNSYFHINHKKLYDILDPNYLFYIRNSKEDYVTFYSYLTVSHYFEELIIDELGYVLTDLKRDLDEVERELYLVNRTFKEVNSKSIQKAISYLDKRMFSDPKGKELEYIKKILVNVDIKEYEASYYDVEHLDYRKQELTQYIKILEGLIEMKEYIGSSVLVIKQG